MPATNTKRGAHDNDNAYQMQYVIFRSYGWLGGRLRRVGAIVVDTSLRQYALRQCTRVRVLSPLSGISSWQMCY